MKYVFLLFSFISIIGYGQRTDFNQIDFKKADSIALSLKGESLENLPVLTHNLTANLTTDVEKFRAIYTWVSTNIENDYNSYLKTKKKRSKLSNDRAAFLAWNKAYTPVVFQNLIKNKKTACTGYAYLIREFAQLAGIECKIIDGFGRTATLKLNNNSLPNHSWNAVKLNNKWYLCDATWSAGLIVIEDNLPKFKSEYYDGYFLADPELFMKNHYPLIAEWTLMTNTRTFNEFLEGPIVYKEAFQYAIVPQYPLALEMEVLKNEAVTFQVKAPNFDYLPNINLFTNNSRTTEKALLKTSLHGTIYEITHTFSKTGLHDIHIRFDDKILATYVVRVKKK